MFNYNDPTYKTQIKELRRSFIKEYKVKTRAGVENDGEQWITLDTTILDDDTQYGGSDAPYVVVIFTRDGLFRGINLYGEHNGEQMSDRQHKACGGADDIPIEKAIPLVSDIYVLKKFLEALYGVMYTAGDEGEFDTMSDWQGESVLPVLNKLIESTDIFDSAEFHDLIKDIELKHDLNLPYWNSPQMGPEKWVTLEKHCDPGFYISLCFNMDGTFRGVELLLEDPTDPEDAKMMDYVLPFEKVIHLIETNEVAKQWSIWLPVLKELQGRMTQYGNEGEFDTMSDWQGESRLTESIDLDNLNNECARIANYYGCDFNCREDVKNNVIVSWRLRFPYIEGKYTTPNPPRIVIVVKADDLSYYATIASDGVSAHNYWPPEKERMFKWFDEHKGVYPYRAIFDEMMDLLTKYGDEGDFDTMSDWQGESRLVEEYPDWAEAIADKLDGVAHKYRHILSGNKLSSSFGMPYYEFLIDTGSIGHNSLVIDFDESGKFKSFMFRTKWYTTVDELLNSVPFPLPDEVQSLIMDIGAVLTNIADEGDFDTMSDWQGESVLTELDKLIDEAYWHQLGRKEMTKEEFQRLRVGDHFFNTQDGHEYIVTKIDMNGKGVGLVAVRDDKEGPGKEDGCYFWAMPGSLEIMSPLPNHGNEGEFDTMSDWQGESVLTEHIHLFKIDVQGPFPHSGFADKTLYYGGETSTSDKIVMLVSALVNKRVLTITASLKQIGERSEKFIGDMLLSVNKTGVVQVGKQKGAKLGKTLRAKDFAEHAIIYCQGEFEPLTTKERAYVVDVFECFMRHSDKEWRELIKDTIGGLYEDNVLEQVNQLVESGDDLCKAMLKHHLSAQEFVTSLGWNFDTDAIKHANPFTGHADSIDEYYIGKKVSKTIGIISIVFGRDATGDLSFKVTFQIPTDDPRLSSGVKHETLNFQTWKNDNWDKWTIWNSSNQAFNSYPQFSVKDVFTVAAKAFPNYSWAIGEMQKLEEANVISIFDNITHMILGNHGDEGEFDTMSDWQGESRLTEGKGNFFDPYIDNIKAVAEGYGFIVEQHSEVEVVGMEKPLKASFKSSIRFAISTNRHWGDRKPIGLHGVAMQVRYLESKHGTNLLGISSYVKDDFKIWDCHGTMKWPFDTSIYQMLRDVRPDLRSIKQWRQALDLEDANIHNCIRDVIALFSQHADEGDFDTMADWQGESKFTNPLGLRLRF